MGQACRSQEFCKFFRRLLRAIAGAGSWSTIEVADLLKESVEPGSLTRSTTGQRNRRHAVIVSIHRNQSSTEPRLSRSLLGTTLTESDSETVGKKKIEPIKISSGGICKAFIVLGNRRAPPLDQ